jgi:hypothetical protein
MTAPFYILSKSVFIIMKPVTVTATASGAAFRRHTHAQGKQQLSYFKERTPLRIQGGRLN